MREQHERETKTSFPPQWIVANPYKHTHPYKQFLREIPDVEDNPSTELRDMFLQTGVYSRRI